MSNTRTAREELDRALGMARRALAFWRRALLVFVVVAAIAVPFALTRPRTYKSETIILYQENVASRLTGEGGGSEAGRRVGARLREVLLSRASLEPIIRDLHIADAQVEKHGIVDAIDDMRKQITFRAREGDTFEISYQGGSPDEVQQVTARLGECIVREAASRRAEQAQALKAFVDAESERNQTDLKAKEAALAGFLAAHPEFARLAAVEAQGGTAAPPDASGARTGGGTISGDPQLAFLEARAAKIQRDLAASDGAPTTAPPPPPPPRPESPELVAARRDLADKLGKYTDKHPDVVAARARLRAAEEAEAAANAARPAPAPDPAPVPRTEADREELRKQLATLQAQIAARQKTLATTGNAPASPSSHAPPAQEASVALSVEYRQLAREVADARERQRQLDDKQFKASMSASSATNDRNIQVSVLDPAYRPTHAISRPRSILLGIALAVCSLLALLTAVASAWFDDRIHGRADLERLDLLPVVGVIPRAAPALPAGDERRAPGPHGYG